ncbi:S8 family peptidase [Qipengyuania atrilutea]|uniref:S8 family serine peptidase n=1 Tax=Qipengyuania atrilutea TaxID=2744473 RepID=A0A850H5N3_9SPHN|nr:S8 family peptidase [Actirhodobacter atriluteus]NVD45807.1 S8 family serine peptidase [Actirhodobacter atriluteus]
MSAKPATPSILRFAAILSPAILLAACGGGGSGGTIISTPPPAPAPTPTPVPAPTPPPTGFETEELSRSDGPEFHGAVTLWQNGITGSGSTIAIIDTGIDTDSPEFAGRISAASQDVAGNESVEAVDDHGTNIALIAAAARNDTGVVGIAYEANILALRTDRPGSCNAQSDEVLDGCIFFDSDIARGVDIAVANGARVINLSLGGSAPSTSLRTAIRRAAEAGVVIVVAAGNAGDGSDPDIDPNQPDPFPAELITEAPNHLIIVGSVDDSGTISNFSNRAGTLGGSFITARGERLCCVYENGVLQVTREGGSTFVTLFSGTSFSAPQVAGAVALLAQAFPNLTGAEIVDLLLDNARDAGVSGVDGIYGTGILDIAAAFRPSGSTAIAGTQRTFGAGDVTAIASPAMGDALSAGSLKTIVTDAYDRPYEIDLAAGGQRAAMQPRLHGAVDQPMRSLAAQQGALAVAFTVNGRAYDQRRTPLGLLTLETGDAESSRVLAASAAMSVDPATKIGFAIGQRSDGLVARLQGQSRPAFMIAGEAGGEDGFVRMGDTAFALRRQVGKWGVTVSGDEGEVRLYDSAARAGQFDWLNRPYSVSGYGLSADRRFGALDTALGVTFLDEEGTVLGAKFNDTLGIGGAETLFLDASAGWNFAPRWRLGGSMRQGFTRADAGGLLAGTTKLQTRAWSLDVTRTGTFQRGDSFGFRLSQPLRVERGGLDLSVPVDFDFGTETASFASRHLSLAPEGREVMGELAWSGWLMGGTASASAYYRTDPGHVADYPEDMGALVRWNRSF